ncbi:hypothetical protein AB0I00_25935 [Streptomyces sp. NPDC050803]|uniref:hypothetical protein n=1 Tax=unclassified Streptomyces TaxID=2593676 RepID=UPI00343E48DD
MSIVLEGAPDSDEEELDTLTSQLRRQLLELDVDRVELTRSDAAPPQGAKPGEAIALGALAVTMAPFMLRGVLRLLETWIANRPVRTVTVELGGDRLELQAVATADQRRLIDAFLAAHEPTSQPPAPLPDSAPSPGSGADAGA